RVGGSSGAISVAYATTNGTATAGTDFTTAQGTLSWNDGDAAAKNISVAISNSTPFSGSRNFKIALSSPSPQASVGSPGTATVTINGSATSAAGTVELSSSTYGVAQGAGIVTVTIKRTAGTSGVASVGYATNSGTAVAGTDFTAVNGTLQWSDGE